MTKGKDDQKVEVMAIFSYLWILCLIPLLKKDKNDFTLFHARQGLVLFLAEIGVWVFGIVPIIGPLIGLLGFLACAALSIIGISQIIKGNEWKMPVLGEWAQKLKV